MFFSNQNCFYNFAQKQNTLCKVKMKLRILHELYSRKGALMEKDACADLEM